MVECWWWIEESHSLRSEAAVYSGGMEADTSKVSETFSVFCFFTRLVMCDDQNVFSEMVIPRNLKLLTCSTSALLM